MRLYEKYCELRDKAGMTDYKVSVQTGIGRSTFTDWKTGRSKPGIEKMYLIAKLFGVTIEYFLEK